MNGTTWTGNYTELATVADANWAIVGVADFNADTKADLLWRNSSTGRTTIWYMDGATWNGNWVDVLPNISDPNWTIAGVADFNADGKPDILWRNASIGQTTVWYMNGANGATWTGGSADLPPVTDPNMTIVGVADFNADGRPDILWRNTSTGQITIWYMNGATFTGGTANVLPTLSDPAWTVVGARDFNGDGKPDILWRNTSTGRTTAWYMNGANWTSGYGDILPAISDPNWKIIGR
jgi:hypothetical protein